MRSVVFVVLCSLFNVSAQTVNSRCADGEIQIGHPDLASVPNSDVVEDYDDGRSFLSFLTVLDASGMVNQFQWHQKAVDAGVFFQILRPQSQDEVTYQLVNQVYCEAALHEGCTANLPVRAGDRIGWRFPNGTKAFGSTIDRATYPSGLDTLSVYASETPGGPTTLGQRWTYNDPEFFEMPHVSASFVCVEVELTTTTTTIPEECVEAGCDQGGCLRGTTCMISHHYGEVYNAESCHRDSDEHHFCGEVNVGEKEDVACAEGFMVCPIDVGFSSFHYVANGRYIPELNLYDPTDIECLDHAVPGQPRTSLEFPWEQCGAEVNPGKNGTAVISMLVQPILPFWVPGIVPGPVLCSCIFNLNERVSDAELHGRYQQPLTMRNITVDGVQFTATLITNPDGEIPKIELKAITQLVNPKFVYCKGVIPGSGGPEALLWENDAETGFGWQLNMSTGFTDENFGVHLTFDSFYARQSDTILFECEVEMRIEDGRRLSGRQLADEVAEEPPTESRTINFALKPQYGAGKSFEELQANAPKIVEERKHNPEDPDDIDGAVAVSVVSSTAIAVLLFQTSF